MLGWVADLFRFAWGLLYWNTRKSWFRLRRGRVSCPCQSPSDSGKALETGCDACVSWYRPERFKRVCPLLVRTADGLRCSVNTADVRPFWSITLRYYGGALLALYAAGVITVFSVLRSVGYPVSIVHVGLPPLWHRVGQARGWFFLMRSQQELAKGHTTQGLLYLANAYEFDPANYEAGLALAKALQLGQPTRSDEIFGRLMQDHPGRRDATAQHWFRALIARGDYAQVAALSARQVRSDERFANVWMRALIFATRQDHDDGPIRTLAKDNQPSARRWRQVAETELLFRSKNSAEARDALLAAWPQSSPPYALIYRVDSLVSLGQPTSALDLLVQHRSELDDEAYWTLRLHCLAAAGATQSVRNEFEAVLLRPPLNQVLLKMMCAQLIRHPDAMLLNRVCTKVALESMPLSDDTAGGWFSLVCAAGASADLPQLHALVLRLRQASQTPFTALMMVESFFRGDVTDRRAVSFLPFLPVPLEITYALIERYPGTPAAADKR